VVVVAEYICEWFLHTPVLSGTCVPLARKKLACIAPEYAFIMVLVVKFKV
jgi:hypothetical protein